MLRTVSEEAWRVLSQRRGVWWLLLWLGLVAVFILLVMAGLVLGWADSAPFPLAAAQGGSALALSSAAPSVLATLAGTVAFVAGVVGPFTAAGFYGVLACAMGNRAPLGVSAFWREGWRNWGRGYGILLMTVLVGLAAAVAAGLLEAVLHLLGTLGRVMDLAGIGTVVLVSLLWLEWSTAHLFRGRWTWRRAVGGGFLDAWRYKWPSLGVLMTMGLVGAGADAAAPLLTRWIAPVGALAALALSGGVLLFSATVLLGWHDYAERQHREPFG